MGGGGGGPAWLFSQGDVSTRPTLRSRPAAPAREDGRLLEAWLTTSCCQNSAICRPAEGERWRPLTPLLRDIRTWAGTLEVLPCRLGARELLVDEPPAAASAAALSKLRALSMIFLDLDLDRLCRRPVVASQSLFCISNSMASVVDCKWCSEAATFFIQAMGLSSS